MLNLKHSSNSPEFIASLIYSLDLIVFEGDSQKNEKLRTEITPRDLLKDIIATKDRPGMEMFALYKSEFQGKYHIRLIKGNEGWIRETIEGWGLIWFKVQFWQKTFNFEFSVNSLKSAQKWSSIYPEWDDVENWNWVLIRRTIGQLNRKSVRRDA